MKRLMDILISTAGLTLFSPIFLVFIILIYLQDYHSPFYIAKRAGKNGKTFGMVKLRSMVINADKIGGPSTSNSDRRITWVGRTIRK